MNSLTQGWTQTGGAYASKGNKREKGPSPPPPLFNSAPGLGDFAAASGLNFIYYKFLQHNVCECETRFDNIQEENQLGGFGLLGPLSLSLSLHFTPPLVESRRFFSPGVAIDSTPPGAHNIDPGYYDDRHADGRGPKSFEKRVREGRACARTICPFRHKPPSPSSTARLVITKGGK